MPLLVLTIALLLAGPAYAADCSRNSAGDPCEPTGAISSSSGKPAEATGPFARPKDARSRKVHPSISAVAAAVQARRSTEATPDGLKKLSTKLVRVNDAGEIQVYVILTEWSPDHVAQLEARGLRVESTVPKRRLIQGWVPSHAVDDLAALEAVKEVRPPSYGIREGVGAVNTSGDDILRAAEARSSFGVSGAGVKVGVISDGVDHLANSVASNDLPGGVEVLRAGSGDEGTAMLEIVHDLAPGSPLAFFGPDTSVDMANGINALAAAGARVVVDDLSFFSEPKFEDGIIADAVKSFATNGRLYVSSAGNRAQQHYRSGYNRLTGLNFPSSDYPAVHDYSSGDFGNTVVVPPFCGLVVFLQWNNRFGAAADDFDLFILRESDSAIVGGSVSEQLGNGDPIEAADFVNPTGSPVTVAIAISEFEIVSPPGSLILDYFAILDCSGNPGLQYVTPSESMTGNHALVEAMPIAAVDEATPTQAEPYSSQGPGSIAFPQPEVRSVPVLTAVDCVNTQTGTLGFFAFPFCGTSAAAPHVAGVAALLIERVPTLSTGQLRDVLTGTAVDLGSPGFDFTYGFGRVDALNAVSFVSSGPHVQVAISLNRSTVAPGDPLQLGLIQGNVGTATTHDLYFGALVPPGLSTSLGCPAGDGLVLFADNFARIVVLCYLTAPPETFAPLVANSAVPAALPPTAVANFGLPWPAGTPAGNYIFVLFSTPPGAFSDGNVGATDITALAIGILQASP